MPSVGGTEPFVSNLVELCEFFIISSQFKPVSFRLVKFLAG